MTTARSPPPLALFLALALVGAAAAAVVVSPIMMNQRRLLTYPTAQCYNVQNVQDVPYTPNDYCSLQAKIGSGSSWKTCTSLSSDGTINDLPQLQMNCGCLLTNFQNAIDAVCAI
jgi:hypothetical protein